MVKSSPLCSIQSSRTGEYEIFDVRSLCSIPLKAGKGPRRLFDVPFPAEDLPIVSLVVISHDHREFSFLIAFSAHPLSFRLDTLTS